MSKTISRRSMISQAGLAVGGAMTLGALSGCGEEDSSCPPPNCADTAAELKDFPYEKYVPADFALDRDTIQEAAYHGYYNGGGCGHGVYSALLGDLARAGAPFDQLPVNFGVFGGGGIAAFGSICGAVLSGTLILNQVVANGTARGAMMTELMRWYETHQFPAYVPVTVDPLESASTDAGSSTNKLVLNWGTESTKPAVTQVAPGSHLCHASVSGWCAGQLPIVNAGTTNQPDKKARCARVTADVAGKVVDIITAYLASGALGARSFTATAAPTTVTECTVCHGNAVSQHNSLDAPPVATGMSCPSCHGEKVPLTGVTHTSNVACDGCHPTP